MPVRLGLSASRRNNLFRKSAIAGRARYSEISPRNSRRNVRPTAALDFPIGGGALEINRAERAIDYSMVAAHPDRHAMTDDDLIAVIDDRHLDRKSVV